VFADMKGLSRQKITLSILLVLTMMLGPVKAHAQQPGPFNNEHVGGGDLRTQGNYSEARNGVALITTWRGADNDQVWYSLNNGDPATIGHTQTNVDPTVVAWGPSLFLIFHVGTNGHIYYAAVNADRSHDADWSEVPDQTTNMAVSAVQLSRNSWGVYLVYRGSGNDQRMWGTWFNGTSNTWADAVNIGGGSALTAPTIARDDTRNRLVVAAQGLDSNIWLLTGPYGGYWGGWRNTNVYTVAQPNIAITDNGHLGIIAVNRNYRDEFALYDLDGNGVEGWVEDTQHTVFNPVHLTVAGNIIYALYNLANYGYWRQMCNCG
jgi:hypothetical protein